MSSLIARKLSIEDWPLPTTKFLYLPFQVLAGMLS